MSRGNLEIIRAALEAAERGDIEARFDLRNGSPTRRQDFGSKEKAVEVAARSH